MAKKRKTPGRRSAAENNHSFKPEGSKIAPITTWEDIADSEDEFHINRDKVLLDDGPEAKRRKKLKEEDAFLELSDDEILGYSSESDDDDNTNMQDSERRVSITSDDEEAEEEAEAEDAAGWGSSKKDYYDNDQAQTEADALEEEAEAKRLQQQRLQKMTRADFGLDDIDWNEAPVTGDAEDSNGIVREKLKEVQITPSMSSGERLGILRKRYPEFEYLANEFAQLSPIFQDLKDQVDMAKFPLLNTLPTLKYRAWGAYIATLAMYFALLTTPARDEGEERALNPDELHAHTIMQTLKICRETWIKARDYIIKTPVEAASSVEEVEYSEAIHTDGVSHDVPPIGRPTGLCKKARVRFDAAQAAASLRAQQLEDAEEELAGLSQLIVKTGRPAKKEKKAILQDSESDFGEEESMDAKAAAEKAKKKKSLQFYTSQIAQKANKRAGAGRDAGGDEDLPHRERLRDRQARLNAEAEKRGKKLDEYGRGGVALGGESDSGEDNLAGNVRQDEDEYYDMVVQSSKSKKDDKAARMEAIAKAKAEGGLVRIVEGEMDEDGKRAIGYVIEKNKGLAPKRKKDVRNPRVKKRKKFEEKKKKLASTRAVYKGGEDRGGYGGEKTGIKTGLVKSIKL